jgi:malyl-CoA/(S)-citramalyl-CoA lyase
VGATTERIQKEREMSSSDIQRPIRRQRSELAVPATSEGFFEKAARGAADAIFLDLEDAVIPERKVQARGNTIAALNEIEWGNKTLSVRVNSLDTEWAVADILEVASRCPRLDMILLPKAASAFDVQFVATLLSSVEAEHRRSKQVGIEVLVESAIGLVNVDQIAAASTRLEAIIFGIGDYSVDMRTYDKVIGTPNAAYAIPSKPDGSDAHRNDPWHFALAKIANACRAFGKRPIDGPYTDFKDLAGFRASARRAAALGFEGKWALHPSQVELANEAFTPAQEEVRWAEEILTTLRSSHEAGNGAVQLRGMVVDLAHEKLARAILSRAALLQ